MTTGQKIAARRKELELSQEALGDKLEQFKASMAAEVELKDQKLQSEAL